MVETSEEPENQGFELKITQDDKKKPVPAKSEAKKQQNLVSDDEKMKQEELRRLEINKQIEKNKKSIEDKKFRRSPHGFWWLKFRSELCNILYNQRKWTENLELINKTHDECIILKDKYFQRILNQFNAKIFIRKGQFKQAIEKFEIVEKEAKENFINDLDLAAFYGDFAEIHFERGEFEKSARLFEESLKIIEGLLNEISFEIFSKNKNIKAINEKVNICEELGLTVENEQEILRKNEVKTKGKKDDKKNIKDDKTKKIQQEK